MIFLNSVRISKIADTEIPLVIEPAEKGQDLLETVTGRRDEIDRFVEAHGALLFRNFRLVDPVGFSTIVAACCGDNWFKYREAATPRSRISDLVSTSTDYPKSETIMLHNENSHVTSWPMRIAFYCDVPPASGGETPIADSRQIYCQLDASVRSEFERRLLLYVRQFGQLGMDWRTAMECASSEELEDYCRANHMDLRWGEAGPTITYKRWSVLSHPKTNEKTWFNHGLFFHAESIDAEGNFDEDQLPYNTYFGDGGLITSDAIVELRRAYSTATVEFKWQRGDLLLMDNMLVAHGRNPYKGERSIWVTLSNPISCEEVADKTQYRLRS